jgi:hypothetical protein
MCSPRNSPAKSNGGLVKNNEIYKPRSFRVQRQRPAPRAAENNNEYQAKNKNCGHGQEHLCGSWNPGGAATRAKQSPVRSPARAHFVSFNFTNTTIRRVPSTSVIDVGKKNVEQNRSRSRFGIAFGAPCRCRASSPLWIGNPHRPSAPGHVDAATAWRRKCERSRRPAACVWPPGYSSRFLSPQQIGLLDYKFLFGRRGAPIGCVPESNMEA